MAINVPAIALARSVVAPDNREVLWEDTSNMNLPFYERVKSYDSNSGQWRMVTQLPLELLNELRKVDGDGSGLDANFLQGRTVNDIIQLAKDGSFTLPNGFIFIGNTLGNAVARAVSGDATLNNIGTLSLIASGVTAGTYDLASLTIDAKGRITSASSYTITVNDIPELPQSKITNLTTDLSARELLANKENSVINTSTTKYPTVNLLKIGLDTKEPTITAGTTGQYWRGDKTFQTLDKTAVGLSNVDNTSDADKPISSATALEFTNVYNEVSTKANNYVDIANIISGYILTDTDAGKLITNSGINVRTLVIPSSLNLPNNTIFIKGRIAIQPNAGVNIELPDTTIITSPTQFTCVADEVYILHKSAFTGDDYILVSVKKSENIGTNDLIITDTIRELQVATDGTFQIVTNDPNNSTLFKVGENSNERFGEIELNSITYDVTTAEPNPTNNGAGIITRINPNEYEIESRSDIGNAGTKRGRIYMSPNETILEQIGAGRFNLNNIGGNNTFEDLRATKKGLEYSADYSANFSVRSLVDKGYVDSGLSTKIGAVIEDTTPQLGGDLDLNGNDINGTGNVDITGNVIADIVQLKGGTGTQGEMSWSTDEETVKLIMDGTTLYMGQDTFVHVRNNTASIITKGTAVYATGTLGASGRITVAPMIANGTIAGRLFIGLTAEDIAIGADGQVCSYGKIRGINTTAYNDGDVLWISPTVAGQLTATEPTAPNLKIATAFVIHDATNGTLMVRAEQGTDLHSDQRVEVSGLTDGDVLTWSTANQRWENKEAGGGGHEIYNGTDITPLPQRAGLRFEGYLEAVDDAGNDETVVDLSSTAITPAEVLRFGENGSGNVDLKIQEKKLPTGDVNGFATEYTASSECILGLDSNSEIKEFEAVEIYNILKEEGVTANKQLVLLDINGNSANVKAKFEISAIAVQNTTANAVTINVGSTALGTDVVNAYALGASETKKLPLGTTFFSITSGQNLFISSGSWNSANINIHVTISKIWQ